MSHFTRAELAGCLLDVAIVAEKTPWLGILSSTQLFQYALDVERGDLGVLRDNVRHFSEQQQKCRQWLQENLGHYNANHRMRCELRYNAWLEEMMTEAIIIKQYLE